jgi:hypothetical protein
MKNINDTMGNRNRKFPACTAVRQPTAPPRPPENKFSYPQIKDSLLIQEAHNN